MLSYDELRKAGFEQCTFAGDCDFCQRVARLGDLFWYRTSIDYVEGDYYCRACANNVIIKQEQWETEHIN